MLRQFCFKVVFLAACPALISYPRVLSMQAVHGESNATNVLGEVLDEPKLRCKENARAAAASRAPLAADLAHCTCRVVIIHATEPLPPSGQPIKRAKLG